MSADLKTVIPVPPPVLLPVEGSADFFPVRRVYCVGRNYADHAIEMGHDPTFFFQKNPDNLLPAGKPFPYPPLSEDVHYEAECVIFLKEGGENIPVEKALDCIYGYAIGIDFTRRDLQAVAKKMGRPWEVAKAFEFSAPVSPIVPADELGHPASGRIWLDHNGKRVQEGDLNQMIWKVPEIIRAVGLPRGALSGTSTVPKAPTTVPFSTIRSSTRWRKAKVIFPSSSATRTRRMNGSRTAGPVPQVR